MPKQKHRKKRGVTREELRYIVFHDDLHSNDPTKFVKDGLIHVARATVNGRLILAHTGEALGYDGRPFDEYPYYDWFTVMGAPLCRTCARLADEKLREAEGE